MGVLDGIKVLELARVPPAEMPGMMLADMGADVLKITAAHLPNIGYQEYDTGHGKLSAHLDLRESKDVEILRGLVRETDGALLAGPIGQTAETLMASTDPGR